MSTEQRTIDRLLLWAKQAGWKKSQLAAKFNISPQAMNNWIDREMPAKYVPLAAQIFNTTTDAVLGTAEYKGSLHVAASSATYNSSGPSTFHIPRFDVVASMGSGVAMPDHETVVSGLDVNMLWIRSNLSGISSPQNLAIITGYGDSMQATFSDGDQLVVDRGVNEVKVDAIYVLSLSDELYIKRLQRRPDGSVLMISDNVKYPPYPIENGDREKFFVLGRVVGVWNFTRI